MTATPMDHQKTVAPARRRYGNIIDPPKTGFFGLPARVSKLAVITIIAGFLTNMFSSMIPGVGRYSMWLTAAVVLVGGGRCLHLMRKGSFGRFKYQEQIVKRNYLKAVKKGWTKYRPGPSGDTPDGSYRLPGPLASTRADDYTDSFGHSFGMVWDQGRRTGTVFFSVAAPGQQLFDQEDIDRMVSEWALFHREAGILSSVIQVAATVVTTKDTGQRLPLAVQAQRDQAPGEVPAAARAAIDDVLALENTLIPRIEHVVSLTFSGQASKAEALPARSREELAQEVSTVMEGFQRILQNAASGSTQMMRAADITDHFYAAYNPGQADAVDKARTQSGTGLSWDQCGPTYANAEKDFYEHSGFYSKSFQQWKPPAALFQEDSLRTLLEPDLGIERKRVTILYRPLTPDVSQRQAMSIVQDASFDNNQKGRKASSVSRAVQEKAARTEMELANGAVLVPFSMMVTVTVKDPSVFPQVASQTRNKASTGVNISIREATYTHDSAFSLSLGAGLVPADFQMKGL